MVDAAKTDRSCEGIPVVSAEYLAHGLVDLLVQLQGRPHPSCLQVGGRQRSNRPQCVRALAAQAALQVGHGLLVLRERFPGARPAATKDSASRKLAAASSGAPAGRTAVLPASSAAASAYQGESTRLCWRRSIPAGRLLLLATATPRAARRSASCQC